MMYLLLRDNKQSGPYSLDELKTKGLKAYDLVWVDGKSAAWRYPCEINELSAFAPVVEEQPFDRFFKKPGAARTASSQGSVPGAQPTAESPTGIVISSSPALYPGDPSSASRKRTIYVTMPAGNASNPARETPREINRSIAPSISNRPIPPEPVIAYQPDPAPTVSNRPRTPEPVPAHYNPDVYSSTQSEGREERVVEIIPHLQQRNPMGIYRLIAIGGCIVVLLAAGIFIGLLINKDNPGLQQKSGSGIGAADNGSTIAHATAQPLPAPPPVVNPAVSTTQTQQAEPSAPTTNRQVSSTNPPAGKSPRITTPRQKLPDPKSLAILPATTTDSATGGPAIIHREAVHRTDPMQDNAAAPDKDAVKANLANLVSVGANKYEVGTFGGISGLQVTVANRSAYPLDLVVVEVQYVQANKKIYKTENLYFHGIGAGSALMLEAPKSSRGIKVQYKITLINSKDLGLTESGI